MKKKLVVLLLLSLAITTFSACGKKEENKKDSTSIELEISEPESIEQGDLEELKWVELGSLTDVEQLRAKWDKVFETQGELGSRTGALYKIKGYNKFDNNNTFAVAMRNTDVVDTLNKQQKELSESANLVYTDVSDEAGHIRFLMAINGYFNILQDSEPGFANPYETLTRAQVMSAVMRATTPVDSKLKINGDFEKAVEASDYNLYAQEVDALAFLNTKNGLDKDSYNSKMTRGEAIYIVVNKFFKAELLTEEIDTSFNQFDDMENAGDLVKSKGNAKDALREMLGNPEAGVDENIYKAAELAKKLSIVGGDSRWDEAITKSEFIEILYKAAKQSQNIENFSTQLAIAKYATDGSLVQDDTTKAAAMEAFNEIFTPEHWGVETKGMNMADASRALGGICTNYNSKLLKKAKTTKGYNCVYDEGTGFTYYSGMMLPTGSGWDDLESTGVQIDFLNEQYEKYGDDSKYLTVYDIEYSRFVEWFGKVDKSTIGDYFY